MSRITAPERERLYKIRSQVIEGTAENARALLTGEYKRGRQRERQWFAPDREKAEELHRRHHPEEEIQSVHLIASGQPGGKTTPAGGPKKISARRRRRWAER